MTCDMKLKCGGVEGGWIQVVDVDMNRDDSCPRTRSPALGSCVWVSQLVDMLMIIFM